MLMMFFFPSKSPVLLVWLRNEEQRLCIEKWPEEATVSQRIWPPEYTQTACLSDVLFLKSSLPACLRYIFSPFSRIIGNLFLICIKSLQGPSKEKTGAAFVIYYYYFYFFLTAVIFTHLPVKNSQFRNLSDVERCTLAIPCTWVKIYVECEFPVKDDWLRHFTQ